MPVLVHISDLHFGRDVPQLAEALASRLREIEPDLVAVSGDLTQHGRRSELAAAGRFLATLEAPTIVVPGNHDMSKWPWIRFVRPWRRWHEELGLPLDPVVRGRGYVAVGVNTARSWGWHYDWSRGRIGEAQRARIAREYAKSPRGALRILVAHHPFLLDEGAEDRGLVGGAEEALAALRRARVDLVLGGHVHLGYANVVAGLVVAQSGTTFSDRLKGEPQGFNLVDATRTRIVVDHFHAERHAFVRDTHVVFERRGREWVRAGSGRGAASVARGAKGAGSRLSPG